MVCEWGMSDVLGPITFGQKEEQIFLGRDIAQTRDFSEQTAQTIDREVRDLVERNYRRATDILKEKQEILHSVALALLDYETIDGEEFVRLCNGQRIERKPPEVKSNTATSTAINAAPAAGSRTDSGTGTGGGAAPAPVPA
jgi:cell division protease FtsH